MKIRLFDQPFTVCKVEKVAHLDLSRPLTFAAHTDEEISLVCPTAHAPEKTLAREDGWRGFRIEGTLDFSLVGILARIASLMTENGIAIFAVSTYDTDYVLMKAESFPKAIEILCQNGYEVI